jgi:histone-lysine N-methyltransferase SETD2
MQILESILVEKKFTYFTKQNPETDAVENIFFSHRVSYNLWRAFPHVMLIDATYKTNEYRIPFVQIVGMTSTNQSFCIAHAFIVKEKTSNYTWVLERLKDLLEGSMEPRVIVTDRDLALMSACASVFPDATKLLCRCHIQRNIIVVVLQVSYSTKYCKIS